MFLGGVLLVAALLAYEHALVLPHDLTRVNIAFFHINAVISLGLLAVVWMDLRVRGGGRETRHPNDNCRRVASPFFPIFRPLFRSVDAMTDDPAACPEIADKVHAGVRVTEEEGLFLAERASLLDLGELANVVRERKNGNYAFLQHEHPPEPHERVRLPMRVLRVSVRPEGSQGLRVRGRGDSRACRRSQGGGSDGDSRLSAGCTTKKSSTGTFGVVRTIHEAWPDIHIKAWTAVEINWFAHLTKQPYRWVLEQLKEAGLGSMPGGGAEIFHPDVRDKICEHKADGENWIESIAPRIKVGLRTNATMLYGHIEQPKHWVDHLLRLRALQDETGGFQTFISVGVPSREHRARSPSSPGGADGPACDGPVADPAGQFRPHQSVLDHVGGERRPKQRWPSARTTSTGPVVHELITTTPARRRPRD